jgi:hypothetical protein
MQMRDRHYHDYISVLAVNQAVGKPCEQASSKPWFYFHCGKGVGNNSSDDPVQFIEELFSQAVGLLVIPGNGIIKFLSGRGKKADIHLRRCLSMTS